MNNKTVPKKEEGNAIILLKEKKSLSRLAMNQKALLQKKGETPRGAAKKPKKLSNDRPKKKNLSDRSGRTRRKKEVAEKVGKIPVAPCSETSSTKRGED